MADLMYFWSNPCESEESLKPKLLVKRHFSNKFNVLRSCDVKKSELFLKVVLCSKFSKTYLLDFGQFCQEWGKEKIASFNKM